MSDINTFDERAKSIRGELRVRTSAEQNLYKRTITINNTGLGAKTDYQVPFQINSRELYLENKATFTCSDFRIYDSDGTTELDFWVESYYTPVSVVWVKVPSIPDGTKDIYLEYGNPRLSNNSSLDDVFGDIFTSGIPIMWIKANDIGRDFDHSQADTTRPIAWNDRFVSSKQLRSAEAVTTNSPQYLSDQINGLPALRFTASNTEKMFKYQSDLFNLIGGSYEIYIVEKRRSTATAYLLQTEGALIDNSKLGIGYSNSTTFRVTQTGATNLLNYSVGSAINTWRSWTIINDRFNNGGLGGAGHYIRLNASAVASDSDTDGMLVSGGIEVGEFNGLYCDSDIAEILWVQVKSSADRALIERYFRAKYRNYGSEPTVTVGSESTITQTPSFTSYLPLLENYKIEKELIGSEVEGEKQKIFGTQKSNTTATIKNLFHKTVFAGNEATDSARNKKHITSSNGYSFGANVTENGQNGWSTISGQPVYDFNFTVAGNAFVRQDFQNIIPGRDYTVSLELSSSNYTGTASFSLQWFDSGFISLGSASSSTVTISPHLQKLTISSTAPTGAVYARVQTPFDIVANWQFADFAVILATDIDSNSTLRGLDSRTLTASTTSLDDLILFDQTDGGVDYHALDQFNLDNDVTTTVYTSTDDDYILFDFQCENSALIDTTNSYIQFLNPAETLDYKATLTTNINDLGSGELVTIKIRKSSFIKTGTGDWGDLTKAKIKILTTSGTQTIYYNYIRLIIDNTRLFNIGDFVDYGVQISDDSFSTSYLDEAGSGAIINTATSEGGWTIETENILDTFLSQSWQDLPSFPDLYWVYENQNSNKNLLLGFDNYTQLDTNWALGANATLIGEVADSNGEYKGQAYEFTLGAGFASVQTSGFIPILSSTQYTFSAEMRRVTTSNNGVLTIQWYDSGFNLLSSSTSATIVLSTAWTRENVTATSPGTAVYCKLLYPFDLNGTVQFATPQLALGTDSEYLAVNDQGFSEFIKKVLKFYFRDSEINVNVGGLASSFNLNTAPEAFLIYPSQSVGQTINEIMSAILGIISYSGGVIYVRSMSQIYLQDNNSVTDISQSQIVEYREFFEVDNIINSIIYAPVTVIGIYKLYRFLGFGGGGEEIKNGESEELTFEEFSKKYGSDTVRIYGQNIGWGFNFVNDPTAPVYNNTNISLDSRYALNNVFITRFTNSSGTDKYLYTAGGSIDSVLYQDSNNTDQSYFVNFDTQGNVKIYGTSTPGNWFTEPGDVTRYDHTPTIQAIGRKQIKINNLACDMGAGGSAVALINQQIYGSLNSINDEYKLYTLDIVYIPGLRVGGQIRFIDPNRSLVYAVILDINYYYDNGSIIQLTAQKISS